MHNIFKMSYIAGLTLLTGCGGGSSGDSTETGVFLDSSVINIGYKTESMQGDTNPQGAFEYILGETVTFYIGDLEFPSTQAQGILTPLHLANATDTSDPRVINMIRLVQTLDQDADLTNGITITDQAKAAATQVDFGLSITEFESSLAVINLISNAGQDTAVTELVSVDDALLHFEQVLLDNGISFGEFAGIWEFEYAEDPGRAIFFNLPDGTYFGIQWEEVNGFVGFEKGAYTLTDTTATYSTDINNDGEALICIEMPCNDIAVGYVLAGDLLWLDHPHDSTSALFNKQSITSNTIEGVWENRADGVMFTFLADGRYFAIQWEELTGFVGFEMGTYTLSGDAILFTTEINSDGEALACTALPCDGILINYTLTGDVLTLEGFELSRSL